MVGARSLCGRPGRPGRLGPVGSARSARRGRNRNRDTENPRAGSGRTRPPVSNLSDEEREKRREEALERLRRE